MTQRQKQMSLSRPRSLTETKDSHRFTEFDFLLAKCYDKTASKLQKAADAPREREMREENWNRSCKHEAKLV